MIKNKITVFAPATVANLAVGFDLLGLALNKPGDEISVKFVDQPGLVISSITGTGDKILPLEPEKNTAGFSALCLLRHLGKEKLGIEMEIHKKMPFGSGLGSSAASAVAGVVAVNELLGNPLSKKELLGFAAAGEEIASGDYHLDNVAPSLLGGIIFTRNNATLDIHSLPIPKELVVTVIYPHIEILTKDARNLLNKEIGLSKSIIQSGNLGALIIGLHNNDYDLIGRSLEDVIIEPQRAKLIPHFYEVKNAALHAGALGSSISGAGPSIFALSKGKNTATKVGQAMQSIFIKNGITSECFVSSINPQGCKRIL